MRCEIFKSPNRDLFTSDTNQRIHHLIEISQTIRDAELQFEEERLPRLYSIQAVPEPISTEPAKESTNPGDLFVRSRSSNACLVKLLLRNASFCHPFYTNGFDPHDLPRDVKGKA